jgi:NTP pyrophosphatase (non-canonical NTP hydrolase)
LESLDRKGAKVMSDKWSRNINILAQQIKTWRESKEFYTPSSLAGVDNRDMMLAKLMLVVTELSEAAEAVRHENLENFKEEIADTLIRLLDITSAMGLDTHQIISDKMDINEGRPKLHGKKCSV